MFLRQVHKDEPIDEPDIISKGKKTKGDSLEVKTFFRMDNECKENESFPFNMKSS